MLIFPLIRLDCIQNLLGKISTNFKYFSSTNKCIRWKERGKAELKEKKDRLKEQERLRKLHDLHEMEVKEVEKVKREQMKVTADNYKHNIKVR